MKKTFVVLMITLLISSGIRAQVQLFLEEQEIVFDDTKLQGWVMPVVNNLEEALKDLDDYVKDRSDVRMKKGGENIIIAEKVSLPAIATKRGDLIGYGYITNSYYAVAVIFRLGYDISLNSKDYEQEMEHFHTYARQFMSYHYEHAYERRIEAVDKEIKDVEKETEKNEKQIENANKKIENNNKRIEKETDEQKIAEYKTEIATLEADIESLTNTLPGLDATLEDLNTRKDKLNTEAHTYLGTIGTL
jgi:valyl-tRNA synthetase